MSVTNTIARPEIAELLGVSITHLVNIIRYTDAEVPEPLRFESRQLVYDREIMLAWVATEPLKNITWKQRVKKVPVAQQLAGLRLAFLSGNLGVSGAQLQRYKLRKIAARHAPRPTQRVEIRGGAYDGFGERRGKKTSQQAAQ
jgi:hypothetical protein